MISVPKSIFGWLELYEFDSCDMAAHWDWGIRFTPNYWWIALLPSQNAQFMCSAVFILACACIISIDNIAPAMNMNTAKLFGAWAAYTGSSMTAICHMESCNSKYVHMQEWPGLYRVCNYMQHHKKLRPYYGEPAGWGKGLLQGPWASQPSPWHERFIKPWLNTTACWITSCTVINNSCLDNNNSFLLLVLTFFLLPFARDKDLHDSLQVLDYHNIT